MSCVGGGMLFHVPVRPNNTIQIGHFEKYIHDFTGQNNYRAVNNNNRDRNVKLWKVLNLLFWTFLKPEISASALIVSMPKATAKLM